MAYEIDYDTISQDNILHRNTETYSSVSYLYCDWCLDNIGMGDVLESILADNLNGLCDLHFIVHEDNACDECDCCKYNTVSRVKDRKESNGRITTTS